MEKRPSSRLAEWLEGLARESWDASYLNNIHYDDLRPEGEYSILPSIPSRFVDRGFLELFLPYLPHTDDKVIEAACPGLQPAKTPGLKLDGPVKVNTAISGYNTDSLLLCMSSIHRVFLDDSLIVDPSFRFYTHPLRKDNGLLAILDIRYLPGGEHLLRVENQRLSGKKPGWVEIALIPFWKD